MLCAVRCCAVRCPSVPGALCQGDPLSASPEYLQTHLRAGRRAEGGVGCRRHRKGSPPDVPEKCLPVCGSHGSAQVCGGHREMPVDAFKALLMERTQRRSDAATQRRSDWHCSYCSFLSYKVLKCSQVLSSMFSCSSCSVVTFY